MDKQNELENRVYQFRTMSLPGQPMGVHMGTSYLINDLWERVQELQRHNELLRAVAIAAQWAAGDWANHCPICSAVKTNGHFDTCPYQDAINGGVLMVGVIPE